ncbi:alpha/beta-hydrolase [Microthyrium microscopicum]|uniref:Alpha/beta-hydrolase n=1 Tax=Microthyrium microscopicum TaxID=703497 RepID=A0A6A6UEM7_9PEZI|nr:alpha/beta-hydrolase [Microthyrium microscopicum]
MHSRTFSAVMALIACVHAAPVNQNPTSQTDIANIPAGYKAGFTNATVQPSANGKAICISGLVDVTASGTNLHINGGVPTNQTAVTELFVESVQIDSTVRQRLVGNQTHVSGTYGIYSELCFPAAQGVINSTTIQLLVPGSGFDRNYWNVAPGYSYVDSAAEQGYTTFFFDRLGTGLSDHPDALQVVQTGLQVSIVHELVHLLRTGGIAGQKFEHVVGVGHSYGSFQLQLLTAAYPKDVDAAVFTGFSNATDGEPIAFAGLDLTIASQAVPSRFSNLSNGYLTSSSALGDQFFFFRAPGFDPKILELADATKSTITLGEYLTFGTFAVAENFTGPIEVVTGEYDLPNCHGDCMFPYNKLAAVKDNLYPNANNNSDWYVVPGSGHGINFHYEAMNAYQHIQNFIKKNGF